MTRPTKWGHIPTPWLFDEVEMKIKGVNIFNDHVIIADVSDTLLGASNIITQINNAKRIVDCVNAMEGIIDPIAFREQYNESKRTKLILTQEELQKLGEQYRNQEETPYIKTSQPKDAPTKADIKELLSYASKYERLREAVDHFVFIVENGKNMRVHKDSVILSLLKDEIK